MCIRQVENETTDLLARWGATTNLNESEIAQNGLNHNINKDTY